MARCIWHLANLEIELTVSYLSLRNPSQIHHRISEIYETCQNRNLMLCRTLELKHLFQPYLDNREIGNAWFNVMSAGGQLPAHKDTEFTKSFIYYLHSSGKSPLVVEDKEYEVKSGDLISYPSFAEHSVPPVQEELRVSLVIETSDRFLTGKDFKRYG